MPRALDMDCHNDININTLNPNVMGYFFQLYEYKCYILFPKDCVIKTHFWFNKLFLLIS